MSDAIYIAGPTASGKSELALLLAEKLGGEILTVDSMQVYRGMDRGTAKPSAADRARVPHHLIDLVEVAECFDVAHYLVRAREAEEEVRARRKRPIFCGGTGLYFKGLVAGIG
ncbi:MAG TPA: isopentenyl transferase family protein, partial [Verrucomicrobiae bacterium]|nr:isopentenyl transferase family protein [Verrucomicrobiae bacterium]